MASWGGRGTYRFLRWRLLKEPRECVKKPGWEGYWGGENRGAGSVQVATARPML